jgi:hypothetical protein
LDDGLAHHSAVPDRVLGTSDPGRQALARKAAGKIWQAAQQQPQNDASSLRADHEEAEEGNGETCVFQLPL